VAELERSGQITAEAAEHHPQRSIITRALGPEPDVEVDTYTLTGREGDLFLLCSDGLTSMVSDAEVSSILRSAESLDAAADELVRAANQSGGKDNITVVLFRLGTAGDDGPPGEDETIAGQVSAAEVQAASALDEPTEPHPGPTASARVAAPPRRRRRIRLGAVMRVLLGLAVLAGVVTGLYALSRQVYFIGTNDAGLVTLYRGVPYELPLGVELYEEEYPSGVPARAIPDRRRRRVLDHEWRSREDAVDLIRALERGRLAG
jgi:PPM family protein phosphatase